MGELNRKWFQIVWALLLFVSITINYIQRMCDALWAHGEVVAILDKTLTWIMLPMTVVLVVWHLVVSWRTGEKYFWRKVRKQASALFIGGGLGFLLAAIVKWCKGEAMTIDADDRTAILAVFSVVGLLILFARYKFRNSGEK